MTKRSSASMRRKMATYRKGRASGFRDSLTLLDTMKKGIKHIEATDLTKRVAETILKSAIDQINHLIEEEKRVEKEEADAPSLHP